jgi:flavin-dependent dehydrogenase
LYTGEAAGLQDFLWGFGMRYAINSGYYAAQSIIHGKDYEQLIKKHFTGRLKASISNRFFVELFGNRYAKHLLKVAKKYGNWPALLHWGYNPTLFARSLYPIGKFSAILKFYKLGVYRG